MAARSVRVCGGAEGSVGRHIIQVTAQHCKVPIQWFKGGDVVQLHTDLGVVSGIGAVARYVARLHPLSGLYGGTTFEQCLVDQWVDFALFELGPACRALLGGVVNRNPRLLAGVDEAFKDVSKAAAVLESHLDNNTYMVGQNMTLADVAVACTLGPVLLSLRPNREPGQWMLVSTRRWLDTCLHQGCFHGVQLTSSGTTSLEAKAASPAALVPVVHLSTTELMGLTVHCQLIVMDKSVYIWLGTDVGAMHNLNMALCSSMDPVPSVSTLIGGNTDQVSQSLCQRLSKRTGLVVMLSYNLPTEADQLPHLAQKYVVQQLTVAGVTRQA